jgi:hypothetical protein
MRQNEKYLKMRAKLKTKIWNLCDPAINENASLVSHKGSNLKVNKPLFANLSHLLFYSIVFDVEKGDGEPVSRRWVAHQQLVAEPVAQHGQLLDFERLSLGAEVLRELCTVGVYHRITALFHITANKRAKHCALKHQKSLENS